MLNLFIGASLAVAGLTFLGLEVAALIRARASTTWATSRAVITHAYFERRAHSRGRLPFVPHISYRYTFLGREYVGSTIAFGVSSLTADEADVLRQRFTPGTEWEVRVWDRRPSVAVLHPGTTPRLWFQLMFSSAFSIVAVAIFIDALSRLE